MFDKIKSIFTALQAGKALKEPAMWKKVQVTTSTVSGLLMSLVVLFPNLGVTNADIHAISVAIANIGGLSIGDVPLSKEGLKDTITGIGTLVFVVLVPYWTVATTEKIGVPAKPEAPPSLPGPRAQIPGH
jgi:hypothetical protein